MNYSNFVKSTISERPFRFIFKNFNNLPELKHGLVIKSWIDKTNSFNKKSNFNDNHGIVLLIYRA